MIRLHPIHDRSRSLRRPFRRVIAGQGDRLVLLATLLGLLLLSALGTVHQAHLASPDLACWASWDQLGDPDDLEAACRRATLRLWHVTEEAEIVLVPIATLAPWVLGLLAGLPLFTERRTALADRDRAPAARRPLRGQPARSLLPLVLLLVGTALAGAALADMVAATKPFDLAGGPWRRDMLSDLGRLGPTLVSRAFAVFGIAVLVGVLFGRAWRSLVAAAVGCALLWVLLNPFAHTVIAEQVAYWKVAEDAPAAPDSPLEVIVSGYRDRTTGAFLDEAGLEAAWDLECPGCGTDFETMPDGQALFDRFAVWWDETFDPAARVVPADAFGTFVAVESGLGLLVGLGTIGTATTVLVTRRRRAV